MFKAIKNKSRLWLGFVRTEIDIKQANFVLFYGPTYSDHARYHLEDYMSLLTNPNFNKTKETVLYLHGYLEDTLVESVHVIVDAYLDREDYNIIILDWGELADGNYMFDAVANLKQLGPIVADTLLMMFKNELDINKFNMVGHSLGGQMAGIIGRDIIKKSNGELKIKRISALDPAFPLFYFCGLVNHINKGDGLFVDIVHTDAWFYGAPVSSGTADFWPNGGKTLQPGCPRRNYKMLTDNDLSSHRRSWWYWAESVSDKHSNKFTAIKAKNWSDFRNGKLIESTDTVVMGHNCPTDISGDFYLQTNGTSPFAKGLRGTLYEAPEEEFNGQLAINPINNAS